MTPTATTNNNTAHDDQAEEDADDEPRFLLRKPSASPPHSNPITKLAVDEMVIHEETDDDLINSNINTSKFILDCKGDQKAKFGFGEAVMYCFVFGYVVVVKCLVFFVCCTFSVSETRVFVQGGTI